MSIQAPLPHPPQISETANDRFKKSFGSWLWGSMIAATVAHIAVFGLWPQMSVADYSMAASELKAIELPPEVEIPPAPEAISRPAMPVISADAIDVDVTIAPNTFESFRPEVAAPPTTTSTAMELTPSFTPMTVRPQILNVPEVQRAMVQQYPPSLRDARIGGRVVVWFLIDERGRVEDTRIETSSGHAQLDQAALRVAGMYRFSPARNRDDIVKVWVTFPIVFRVDPEAARAKD